MRFADVFLINEVDKLFDLSGDQKKSLNPEVKKIITNIKKENFPTISEFLQDIAVTLENHEKSEEPSLPLDRWFSEAQAIFRSMLLQFEDVSLQLLAESTDSQFEVFYKKFNEKTQDLLQKTNTEAKLRRFDQKRTERWLKTWIKRPTSEQKLILEEFIKMHPTPISEQVKHRNSVINSFKDNPKNKRPQWLKDFYRSPENLRSSEYQQLIHKREEGLKTLLHNFHKTLSTQQRTDLIKELRSRSEEFRRLSLND